MSNVIMAGFPEEVKEPKKIVNEIGDGYKERLTPIKDKKARAIINRLSDHLTRVENIVNEIAYKRWEIQKLKNQVATLQEMYDKDFNRETMRQLVEVETEQKLIEKELRSLMNKSYNTHGWKCDLTLADKETLIKAYHPIGEKKQQLFAEMKKAKEQYDKSLESFKSEHSKNHMIYATLVGLVERASGNIIDLNRVSEWELNKVLFQSTNK